MNVIHGLQHILQYLTAKYGCKRSSTLVLSKSTPQLQTLAAASIYSNCEEPEQMHIVLSVASSLPVVVP